MLRFLLLYAALGPFLQNIAPPNQSGGGNCLTAGEVKRLSQQQKVDGRVKVYKDISERYHQAIISAAAKKAFDEMPALISCWKDNLTVSLKDVEANINRKKKSGALIDYEIQLRRSIVDMNDVRLKATYEKQDAFDSWIAQANTARQRFVDILFQR
jgi:hypothetical protein